LSFRTFAGLTATFALMTFALLPAPATAQDRQTVQVQFRATVGDHEFACGVSYNVGLTSARVTPSDFRFYVSDVALIDHQGRPVPVTLDQDGRWQRDTVALLDFEDGTGPCSNGTNETRHVVTGSVPRGSYSGLQFTLGIPFALNHQDATLAGSPLNLTSLFWTWQGGYKFLRVDLEGDQMTAVAHEAGVAEEHGSEHDAGHSSEHEAAHGGGHGSGAWAIHLGSAQCAAASASEIPTACAHPNRATVELREFDARANVVVADLGALLAGANVESNQPDTAFGCMSEPEDADCAPIMRNLGLPFGAAAPSAQQFFSVR
jgi:uncharacterized repeat protein (TIGR04052 family)